ncbi:hypothetical protein ACFQ48_03800 [Hymenobacter caeli]|uniref:Uncharacterized protein n=1 Tax=Hymenobacter caeli TaxID=2735894 RepID=A0ABX2FNH9_9BACT|nr:hypothetical protein [Hymenobacter caeli]NRT17959.1 hypothetical protein [Hymenobacter caeli]
MDTFLSFCVGTLPLRLRCLVKPYLQALVLFVVGFAGLTALLTPWALGYWWSVGVPVTAGFGACWWLWYSWAPLARNYKGETRLAPLVLALATFVTMGFNFNAYLFFRLGEVRDVQNTKELLLPSTAIFFRLRGPFYAGKPMMGRHIVHYSESERGGARRYYAKYYYACPLLAYATDTTNILVTPPAWLGFAYEQFLGENLSFGKLDTRQQDFAVNCEARVKSLNLTNFTYLVRDEEVSNGLYRAVHASRLAPTSGTPLLLLPAWTPFAQRGNDSLHWTLLLTAIGSASIVLLLLVMPLRKDATTNE